jgi:hypothetical protein
MALLNYTTKIDSLQSASEIEVMLIRHGAKSILKECDSGKILALSFMVSTQAGDLPFRMPVNVQPVHEILKRQKAKGSKLDASPEQAERVAWRILKDWTEAQMAIVETEMMRMEEVFFARIYNPITGKTLFEAVKPQQFLLEKGTGK